MTITQTKSKSGRKSKYPDYISLDILDEVIKSGADPMEMISQMKKALMERVMEAELDRKRLAKVAGFSDYCKLIFHGSRSASFWLL